jgi:hypothetical protein
MPTRESLAIIGIVTLLSACTTTQPTITDSRLRDSLKLAEARVAVLPFEGAPDHSEAGREAREITVSLLVESYRVALTSPSGVDAYVKQNTLNASEFDLEPLGAAARSLNAAVLIWGRVNQFTPYRFDRLAPASPPYVDATLYGFRVGGTGVSKVTGHKQGGLPGTIWSRQPTFDDVARPLVAELLALLR